MARAARSPKTKDQLRELSLVELNAEIRDLQLRESIAGSSVLRKAFRKEREIAERIREEQFGVASKPKAT
ncbi:MAG TPA: hypothetical protein VJ797_11470 [Burkholderiales bacterium]|nr:hypothetical protein [Burkholderiales bacterium]